MNQKQKKKKQYSNRAIAKFNAICAEERGTANKPLSSEAHVDILMNRISVKERKVILKEYVFPQKTYELLESKMIERAFEKEVLT
jgi:hypothetical protein